MGTYKEKTEKELSVKVINNSSQKKYISHSDAEMDKRAVCAVKAAIEKAKICKKPIALYDVESKKVYLKYANGKKKYIE